MRRFCGLTLIELLTVIVILALLIALLLPVILNARKRSYVGVCTSNLRQIYTAFDLYRQDYNNFASNITKLTLYIKNKDVLKCPADPYKKLAGYIQSGPPNMLLETSYFYFLPSVSPYLDILQEKDPSHGIIVCVLHGDRVPSVHEAQMWPAELIFLGKVSRLRVDGSIKAAYAEMLCFVDAEGVRSEMRHPWYLYTDVRPIPQEVLDTDSALRNARIVPCD